jgi:hypothetical protein
MSNSSTQKTLLLHAIHNAVFTTLNNCELISVFEKQGLSRSIFEDGKSIYEHATSARAAEVAMEDDLREADTYLKKFQTIIREEYMKFTDAAKKCFGRDSLEMLGLHKRLPRSDKSFIECAQESILKIKEHPDLKNYLCVHGFNETRVAFASLIIQSYEQVSKDKEMLKKQLVAATREREASFLKVVSWLQNFILYAIPAVYQGAQVTEMLGLVPDELDSIINTTHPSERTLVHC